MNLSFWLMGAAALSGTAFWVLVVIGTVSWWRRGGVARLRGFRAAEARVAQRFARGEVDEAMFRQIRADLRTRT